METHPAAEELFLSSLGEIERAARFVARRAGLLPEDADDLCATVKLRLIENDYEILRRFGGRCSLGTYVASIAHRLHADEWMHVHGRWRPSREAQRLGEAAILLEGLLLRDGRSLQEALPLVQRIDPSLTRSAAEELVARLPERSPRPRLVAIGDAAERADQGEAADGRILEAEHAAATDAASRVVRETLGTMSAEDRVVLRLRFAEGMRVSDIARVVGCDQRPLYRRIEALMRTLRDALTRAGIDDAAAQTLIGAADVKLDFGWQDVEVRQ